MNEKLNGSHPDKVIQKYKPSQYKQLIITVDGYGYIIDRTKICV